MIQRVAALLIAYDHYRAEGYDRRDAIKRAVTAATEYTVTHDLPEHREPTMAEAGAQLNADLAALSPKNRDLWYALQLSPMLWSGFAARKQVPDPYVLH
jgi:hypothetical protein